MSAKIDEEFIGSDPNGTRMADGDGIKLTSARNSQPSCQNNCCKLDDEHTSTETTVVSSASNPVTSNSTAPAIMWGMQNLVDSDIDLVSFRCGDSPHEDTASLGHHQASRRKRRKQMAPPQKFPACSTPSKEYLSVPDESDGEDDSVRTGSEVSESDDEDGNGFVKKSKRFRNEISSSDKFEEKNLKVSSAHQCTNLIDEISRQAMDAVRQCITPTSLFACGSDHQQIESMDDPREDETDQIVERAMQHLEPQIARLLGQSIRRSIQTIRAQTLIGSRQEMITRLETKRPNSSCRDYPVVTKLSMNNADKKDSSGFTIRSLSGDLQLTNMNSNCNSSSGTISVDQLSSEINLNATNDDDRKTKIESHNSILHSKALVEDNRVSFPNRTFPVVVPPLSMRNQWKFGSPTHPSVSEAYCMLSTPATDCKVDKVLSISHDCPAADCCENESTHYDKDETKLVDRKTKNSKCDNEETVRILGQTDYRTVKAVNTSPEITGNKNYNISEPVDRTISGAEQSTFHCDGQTSDHQNAGWKPLIPPMSTSQPGVSSAAAAAAILTAFGLTNNPFWAARRPVSSDCRLPPWFPGYSPNLLQWASENLASIGSNSTNAIDSQPMTNVPQFTMGPSFPGLGNSNVMDLTSSLPNSVNSIGLSVDEQTEALPLVVRGMRKDVDNNQIGRFTPDELSTLANENKFGSMTITSAGYSPGTVMNYQGGLLSRRKRTKVTDTRMSSRGPRAVHCVSLRTNSAVNATACTGLGFFKSIEEKNFPTKTPNTVNMLAECPTSTTSSLGRMFKSDNTDRPTSDMIPSPTNLTEVRLNSSSSSPSPSSIRLSGGSHEQMDGDSGRLLFNRNTLPTGFYSSNQIHNVQVAIRHGMGSIANLMNKERHNTEADTFEQVLAKTFHSCPLTKRSLDSTGKPSSSQLNALFDPTMTSTSSSQTLETGYQLSHANPLLLTRDLRTNSMASLTRNSGLDLPGIRAPLTSFGKPTNQDDNLFKRGLHTSSLLPASCCDSNGMIDNPNGTSCTDGMRTTSTLTPVHLRKAKLMFFYTRYPNSTLIKMYFPDVKFYKNNTAQLVKWFSNFREFYYIQMEKFARVAISEGIRSAEQIHVTTDSELYRALNLHYNRNQQLDVPQHFRIVVEATLREFFNALMTGKDSEQSWKKPIYKIIARMDQPVPEFFKNSNWMEQLADG